ncbi:MAG: Na+/H+ antiporter subunit E [Defluviitaleaceae bacterium]|nr:Na+/H+ antiporter subunit E [Defluviitaleaceae bacterium]
MRNIFIVVALTAFWVILVENISILSVVSGAVVGFLTLLFSKKYLPLKELDNIKFSKLISLPFYMVGQIYIAGIYVTKIILSSERVDLVTVESKIKDETLISVLGDLITLTPGSIVINTVDNKINLLWLRRGIEPDVEDIENDLEEILINDIEKRLIRAQK